MYKWIAMLLLAASSAFGFGDYQIFNGTNSVDSGGAVLYPPSSGEILQWLDAYPDSANGEPEFSDKRSVVTAAEMVGAPCLTFTAAHEQYAVFPATVRHVLDGETVVIRFRSSDWTTGNAVTSWLDGAGGLQVRYFGGGQVRVFYKSNDAASSITSAAVLTGTDDDVVVSATVGASGSVSVSINGTVTSSGTVLVDEMTARVALATDRASAQSLYGSLCIYDFSYTVEGADALCSPITATSGLTLFDVSLTDGVPNGNHGTIDVGTGDETTMWNANTQPNTHYFLENGGRVDAGVYIPALLDGSACADGSPIENVGGYVNNGASSSMVQTDSQIDRKSVV